MKKILPPFNCKHSWKFERGDWKRRNRAIVHRKAISCINKMYTGCFLKEFSLEELPNEAVTLRDGWERYTEFHRDRKAEGRVSRWWLLVVDDEARLQIKRARLPTRFFFFFSRRRKVGNLGISRSLYVISLLGSVTFRLADVLDAFVLGNYTRMRLAIVPGIVSNTAGFRRKYLANPFLHSFAKHTFGNIFISNGRSQWWIILKF